MLGMLCISFDWNFRIRRFELKESTRKELLRRFRDGEGVVDFMALENV